MGPNFELFGPNTQCGPNSDPCRVWFYSIWLPSSCTPCLVWRLLFVFQSILQRCVLQFFQTEFMTHCEQKRRIKTQKPPTWLPYSFLMTEFSVLNNVALLPRRIVPPRSPWVCSGISTTTGWGVSGSISVELASLKRKHTTCRKKCFQKHRLGY